MRRDCRGPRLAIGSRSIGWFRAWWTRCRMGRAILPRCRCFWPAACPEVMLELRAHGLLDVKVKTVSGETLDTCLDWWQRKPAPGASCGAGCKELDGIDPEDVIMSPDRARSRGLTSAVCFPIGNLAPEGSVVKSTAIDPSLVGEDQVFRHVGPGAGLRDRRQRRSEPSRRAKLSRAM